MDSVAQSTSEIKEFSKCIGAKLLNGRELAGVFSSGISIDTRTLQKEDIYFAIRGKNLDGHNFLHQAKNSGASGFVVDQKFYETIFRKNPDSLNQFFNVLVVPDTTKALQKMAFNLRRAFKGPVIGITGSSGKTTTKEIVKILLQSQWNVLATQGNQNNYIGLPLNLLKLTSDHEALIAELGASYPGEIGELCGILMPDWGIITNVYPCHLEGFGSLDNIYKTKIQLAENVLNNGGTIVVNGDDSKLMTLAGNYNKGSRVTFGVNPKCDFAVTSMKADIEGSEFVLNDRHLFRISTQGKFNMMNAAGAVALAASMGVRINKISELLRDFIFPNSRFHMFSTQQGIRIIDDAYNSNPTSLRLAVESFEEIKTEGRKVLVCADMLELGEKKKEFHFNLGEAIAKKSIDAIVAIGPLMKEFLRGVRSVPEHGSITYGFDNNVEAKIFLKEFLKSGDLVLFKGSRSMKLEEIIQCFTPSYIR